MMISRIVLLLALPIAAAQAQQYPTKSIRIIAPFTAGGPVDIASRILAQ
jgi:tripartite-type tricarboxylate transporter receptor subunit TctC